MKDSANMQKQNLADFAVAKRTAFCSASQEMSRSCAECRIVRMPSPNFLTLVFFLLVRVK